MPKRRSKLLTDKQGRGSTAYPVQGERGRCVVRGCEEYGSELRRTACRCYCRYCVQHEFEAALLFDHAA